tara:strand:- start:22 stop:294 length:273 start_codon:yes stop_codon:yes gene_type:complete
MSENNTDQTKPKHRTILIKTGLAVWHWEEKFKTLEEATEFLLDQLGELGPLSNEVLRRNKEQEKEILKLKQTITSLERRYYYGRKRKSEK